MFAVVLVLFGYLAWFYSIRYVCNSIIRKLVNKSYEKKLRKGTTFREWFGFKKFRLEIPHIHISLIYITLWLYIALMIIFVVLYFTQAFSEKTLNIASMFVLIASWISAAIYESFFLGFHWNWTRLYNPDKCSIRGVDKKQYMEARRKMRSDIKKSEKE